VAGVPGTAPALTLGVGVHGLRGKAQADCPVPVGAQHLGACLLVAFDHFRSRVAVAAPVADRYDRNARPYGGDERGAGRGGARVVRDEQDVGAQGLGASGNE